ncbi:MAG: GT4 family glycosyltransferase PelF [Candidatus Acidiferrales bacterium]|jgi:glycosyltransferase involved in cell wall biosynthesis
MKPSKRIRVLLTVPHLNRTQSPYREMMAIAKYLDRDEFDLSICALRNGGHEETGPILDRLGIPWFTAIFRPRKLSAGELKVVWRAQRQINRHGPFDIQHSLDFTSNPTEAIAATICGRRYVYNQRNMNENGHPFALRMKFRFSGRIVAIADHVREFLVEQGARPRRLVKIPNGLDLEQTDLEFSKTTSQPGNLILVLGQMEPRKRHQDVIKAMPAVLERHPQMRLAIAGHVYNTAYFEELRRLVAELGLQASVDFLGARNDVPELMRQSKALVLSSESEGLPWVILEAMAARLPVVASDIPANREVVKNGQTGLLAPLGDPAGYAESLNRLLIDPGLAARIAAEARAMVERRFAAEVMVRQTEGMYREMTTGARRGVVNPELVTRGAD